mgnify:CR=1 FL=1
MLPHGSNAPQLVEHSRSGAILPLVSILSQARRRERASPMTPPRRCQGPSPDQRVVPYNAPSVRYTASGPVWWAIARSVTEGLLPIKREIRLWDKPASTPSMIAARAWAQASEDSPQPASK